MKPIRDLKTIRANLPSSDPYCYVIVHFLGSKKTVQFGHLGMFGIPKQTRLNEVVRELDQFENLLSVKIATTDADDLLATDLSEIKCRGITIDIKIVDNDENPRSLILDEVALDKFWKSNGSRMVKQVCALIDNWGLEIVRLDNYSDELEFILQKELYQRGSCVEMYFNNYFLNHNNVEWRRNLITIVALGLLAQNKLLNHFLTKHPVYDPRVLIQVSLFLHKK